MSTLATRCAASSSRAASRTPQHGPLTFVRFARKGPGGGEVDPRKRIIQRMLYPRNATRGESPIGSYRQDATLALRRAIPNNEVHETVERAWLLHKRHERKQRVADLQTKWNSMRAAMEELRLFDPERYEQVNVLEDPRMRIPEEEAQLKPLKGPERQFIEGRIRGLFPREFRVATNTPSRAGWNHRWRSPITLAAEAREEQRVAAEASAVSLATKRSAEESERAAAASKQARKAANRASAKQESKPQAQETLTS